MDVIQFLREVTALPGVPGYEAGVNGRIAEAFRPLCDEVSIDSLESVVARVGSEGPKVMLSAHQDEIGMVVSKIEDDGSLRLRRNGGVDPRVLPAHEVIVKAQGGDLFGVVGAKPPHLLSPEDREKAVKFSDLYVDVGFAPEVVKERVRIGDVVVFKAPLTELQGGVIAGKTLDDRASVASMLVCAEALSRLRAKAQTFFVASSQEEIGANGALTAAYNVNPDFAIAIDVTHGDYPNAGKGLFPLDKLAITTGPNIHPMLRQKLEDCAKRHRIPYEIEVCPDETGTDAWEIQTVRDGIPSLLISIPQRYMHTTVEALKVSTVEAAGELCALFISEITREWEELTWY